MVKPCYNEEANEKSKELVGLGAVGLGTVGLGALLFFTMLNNAVIETTDNETAVANSIPPTIAYRKIAENFDLPTKIAATPIETDERLFIVERKGIIRILDANRERISQPFLDIERNVLNQGENGLLGLAFHPDYQANGRFFINYVRPPRDGEERNVSVVAEYVRSKADDNRADATSFRQILELEQPYGNHNGGELQFGPDGFLYIGFGDGGSAGDPENRAQDLGTWHGKILRIDVDSGDAYAVPEDNPFTSRNNAKSEIWSYGWRNPWRFSFDRQTDEMYIGDVGQGTYEEINREPANMPGLNYGWRCYEGDQKFDFSECSDATAYISPYIQYGHEGNQCSGSVTGGYVYRGEAYPKLDGYYVYADYCLNRLYLANTQQFTSPFVTETGDIAITSFGENQSGELFFADGANGDIYQLVTE